MDSASAALPVIESGVDIDKQCFIWRIKNFAFIAGHDELLNSQRIEFNAGSSISRPSKWNLYLRVTMKGGKKSISLFYSVKERAAAAMDQSMAMHSQLSFDVYDKQGKQIQGGDGSLKHMSIFAGGNGWGLEVCPLDSGKELPDPLELHVNFTLVAPAKQVKQLTGVAERFIGAGSTRALEAKKRKIQPTRDEEQVGTLKASLRSGALNAGGPLEELGVLYDDGGPSRSHGGNGLVSKMEDD